MVDAEKCDGCGKCTASCPQSALKMETQLIDLDDKLVAMVTEDHRKKIKYTCQPCKPEGGKTPCMLSCPKQAIKCVWNPR